MQDKEGRARGGRDSVWFTGQPEMEAGDSKSIKCLLETMFQNTEDMRKELSHETIHGL